MSLFDVDSPDTDLGYCNIRAAQSPIEADLKKDLESLWNRYEPFADTNFCEEFARQPDTRFWEMYLTVQLLTAGKNVTPRSDLAAAYRDACPDIHILEGDQTIWIEATAPEPGAAENLDRVPDLVMSDAQSGMQAAPRRQVELRITGSLLDKTEVFENYRRQGIVAQGDFCVVAISGSQFFAQSARMGLPHAVTAVYPIGDEYFVVDRNNLDIVDRGHHYSGEINRDGRTPIPRTAFQHERFAQVSGLIWSRRSIGNFSRQVNDFMLVHNFAASKQLSTGWFDWAEEYIPDETGEHLTIARRAC